MRNLMVMVAVVMATAFGCGGEDDEKKPVDEKPVDEQFRDMCPEVTAHADKVTDDSAYEFVSASDPAQCDGTVYTTEDIVTNCDLEVEEKYDADKCQLTWETTCWGMPALVAVEINMSGDPVMELVLDGCLWVAL